MGYVTESIRFRTATETPLEAFAECINKVKAIILASGMEQVSLGDWPNQMGEVVAGEATGNDKSLSDLSASTRTSEVGSWVFKHPQLPHYVELNVRMLANTYPNTPYFVIPLFYFNFGSAINPGASEFSGSTFQSMAISTWYTSSGLSANSTGYGTSRYPTSTFLVRCYCGKSGFWIYSDGGVNLHYYTTSITMQHFLNNGTYPALFAAFLIGDDSETGAALTAPPGVSNSAVATSLRALGAIPVGVGVGILALGSWREGLPGGLGTLDAPHVLTSSKGIRVAQAQVYGTGDPVRLPLAMVQASFTEIPFRLDLDGSGERTWLPIPAIQAVVFISDEPPPTNTQHHCIYALPASDD